MAVRRFEDLRTWQSARRFEIAAYKLIDTGSLAHDVRLREQLREAATSAVSHIAEGHGRFDPADNARFVKMARPSLLECANHWIDAVDAGHIADAVRAQHQSLIDAALKEIGGALDYLQSPEAERNAERIRQARIERRRERTLERFWV